MKTCKSKISHQSSPSEFPLIFFCTREKGHKGLHKSGMVEHRKKSIKVREFMWKGKKL